MGYWCAYLSGVSCKLFAIGLADTTATLSSLASVKSRTVYLSGAGLPGLSWKKRPLNMCVCVCACVCVIPIMATVVPPGSLSQPEMRLAHCMATSAELNCVVQLLSSTHKMMS